MYIFAAVGADKVELHRILGPKSDGNINRGDANKTVYMYAFT